MFRARCCKFALTFVCLSPNPPAQADTVLLSGKEPFRNVTITDVRRGILHFRGVSGEVLQKPVGLVTSVTIDALPQLEVADRALLDGEFDAALAALKECAKDTRDPWQRTLVRYRQLAVLSAAGRTEQALAAFIELVREEPQTPAENLPANIGPAGSSANRAALALLRRTRLRGTTPALDHALATRRLELTLLEDAEAVPGEFAPLEERAATPAVGSRPSEEDDAPLLFGTPRAAPTAVPIALARDSPLRRVAEQLRAAGDARGALRLLERALPFVRRSDRGWWTLDAARCRIELRECARAADELLAVAAAASADNRALAARALYYVGLAHEGLNRPDVAVDQYRELRSRDDLPVDLRAEIEAALERLRNR